jgi:4'-phosphopantetheinyl transferase
VTAAVRIWIGSADLPAEHEATYREVLSADERVRASALASGLDRRSFTVAHGALRMLAAREIGVPPGALNWTAGRYGKPVLAAWPRCHTSLSHSGGAVAVAIARGRPVGVDVQGLVPGLNVVSLSARFFPRGEAEYVAAGGDAGARADRFGRLWVRKEAVVKAAGGRLWPNLRAGVRGRDVVDCAEPAGRYRVKDVAAPAGFLAAVALAGEAPYVLEVSAGLGHRLDGRP